MRTLNLTRRAGALLSSVALLALAASGAVADPANKGKLLLLPSLANPGHEYSEARAISGDGQVVVGVSASPDTFIGQDGLHAVMWGPAFKVQDIGSIGADPRNIAGTAAVNFDGTVIAGFSTTGPGGSGPGHAFVSNAGTITDLGTLGLSSGISAAFGISGDGKVAVGQSEIGLECECALPQHAFRWTKTAGMVDLGTLEGLYGTSVAKGTNADGSLTVGSSSVNSFYDRGFLSTDPYSHEHAAYWNGSSGPVDLNVLTESFGNSHANAVNAQGALANALIVGAADTLVVSPIPRDLPSKPRRSQATLWTLTGPTATRTSLGTIGNYFGTSVANAISAPGTIVVGNSDTASGQHAFRWSQSEGMQDLNVLLKSVGVDLGTAVLTTANGISANGQFIVGSATIGNSIVTLAPGGKGLARLAAAPPATITQGYLARYVSAANIGGVTTSDSVYGSVDGLAGDRQGQMVTTRVLTSVLQGVNEQVNCSNCISAFGSVGSFSAGIHGRYSLTDRLTFLAGGAFAQFRQGGAEIKSAPIFDAALRYDPADWGASRPFVEVGATASPHQDVRYSRTYANGAGTATGIGTTRVDNYAVYGRVGWVNRFTPTDEVAASAEIWSGWQHVRGYSEAFNQQNPFEATVQGGTDRMNLVKLGAQWTHLFGTTIEFNLNGGIVRSFGSKTGVNANIPGFGAVVPLIKDQTWVEAGARIGYRFSKNAVLDLFANMSSGEKPIGTHVHGGLGMRVNF